MVCAIGQPRGYGSGFRAAGRKSETVKPKAKISSVAVVIPMYRTGGTIRDVLSHIGASVSHIFAVDDCCPEGSGHLVRETVDDPRVSVIFNKRNLGVGGATAAGFRTAFDAGIDTTVKLDGDGQHRPEWIPALLSPIVNGNADMAKGNRFADFAACLQAMPLQRLAANVALSLASRPASGYWQVSDPSCGLFALNRKIIGRLDWARIDNGYFFETDLLFHIGLLKGRIVEIPIAPIYHGHSGANSRLLRQVLPFAGKLHRNLLRRIAHRLSEGRSSVRVP